MIQEELKDVQEQQSSVPISSEEIRDELATSSRKWRAIGKPVHGHLQCDTRVPRHMREECHEAVDRGETFWPAMPPGERSQPRYFTPSERPRMSYERPTMPPGVRGDGTVTHGSGTFRENKMKITKSQLKQMIKEELDSALEEGNWAGTENFPLQEPTKGEGSMAQGQLHRIGELADMISQQFDDSTNLEEWVEAKITKAQDYLSSVMNYMRGQADEKAAEEILSTRMGSYRGTTLPGGEKIK